MRSDRDTYEPGFYWVRLDLGEGETDDEWTVGKWDGRNWYAVGEEGVVYVAVVGRKIEEMIG